MKKSLIVVLFISQIVFSQKLSKEQLIEKLSVSTCSCISDKEFTKENLEMTLGLCMIEDFGKFEKEIEKYYGKNILSNDAQIEKLGADVGVKLASTCPKFLEIVMNTTDSEEEVEVAEEYEDLFVTGNFFNFKSEQFITFSIKEETGKVNDFILLNNFDNSFLITDNILKSTDLLDVYYYELEMYDAKIKKFVTYKIVNDIIKK